MREVPEFGSRDDLIAYLRRELGFCGCAAPDDAIAVLRDVLSFAREFRENLGSGEMVGTKDRGRQWYRDLMARIGLDEKPGVAIWFLYMLDRHGLIEHASNVTECWTTPKGEQLLSALE